jgi:hypothetical protein
VQDFVNYFLNAMFQPESSREMYRMAPFFCKQLREELMKKIVEFMAGHCKQVNNPHIFADHLRHFLESFLHSVFSTLIQAEQNSGVNTEGQVDELMRTYVNEIAAVLQALHSILDLEIIGRVGEKIGYTVEEVLPSGVEKKKTLKFSASPSDLINVERCNERFTFAFH